MDQINKHSDLRTYYSNEKISREYINERFTSVIGRILHEKQVAAVNATIKSHQINRILELACGPARLTCDIEGGTYHVAVDGNSNMIAEAQRRLADRGKANQWRLHTADIFEMNLHEKFDLIYTFRFIRHFKEADRKKIYRKIEHHLSPGGMIIFDVVNREVSERIREKEGKDAYPIYDELYTESQFREEMESIGWRIDRLIPLHPRYDWLRALQIYVAPRSTVIAYQLMKWIETAMTANPLEWIAVCQCG